MSFLVFMKDAIQLVPKVSLLWLALLQRIVRSLWVYIRSKPGSDQVLFLFLFLQLAFSLSPWFTYEITFLEGKESVYIAPKTNILFILISFSNFFFLGFWKSTWTRFWFFTSQIISLIALGLGFWKPKLMFHDFLNPDELQSHSILYGYASILILNLILGYFSFQKEDQRYQIS